MSHARNALHALAAGLLAAGCVSPVSDAAVPELEACAAPAFAEGFVEVRAGEFVQDGAAVVPHGVNSYPLLQHVGDGRFEAVRDIFDQAVALGRPVVRTNAFMDGGDNPARLRDEDGAIREQGLSALDALIAEAAAFDVRLLLLLANNWSDYGGAPAIVRAVAPSEALPKDAFFSDPRAVELQRSYVRTLALRINTVTGVRYAEDPTIFAWELVNEARCEDPAYCSAATLEAWAKTMSDELRAAGARQPIAWGGAGYRGEHGEDLERIAQRGGVDVLTVHLYADPGDTVAAAVNTEFRVATAISHGVQVLHDRIALARAYQMPLLIEEIGYRVPDHTLDRDGERAQVLGALLATAHEAGVAAFPWMIGERGRPDYDGHLIRPAHDRTQRVIRCLPAAE